MGAAVAVGVGWESSVSLIGVPRLSAGTQAAIIAAAKTEAATTICVRPSIFMGEARYPQKRFWGDWANYSLALMTPYATGPCATLGRCTPIKYEPGANEPDKNFPLSNCNVSSNTSP